MSSLVDSLSTANRMVKAAKKLNRGSVQTTASLYCCKISCHYSSIFQPRQKQCQRCFISSEFYFSTVFTSFGVEIDPFSPVQLSPWPVWHHWHGIGRFPDIAPLLSCQSDITLVSSCQTDACIGLTVPGTLKVSECQGTVGDTVSSFFMWILAHYLFDLQGVNMVGVS